MKFIIESSPVPIYNRIATAFAKTLMEFGHTVHFIDASGFSESDFANTINDIEIDYYISTNELNVVQKKSDMDDTFLFEKLHAKIIFIHHDNIFSAFHNISFIAKKLQALKNISQRSHHFCLETSNIDLLKSAGIDNAFKINHASEFNAVSTATPPQRGVTFIGHLMSNLHLYPTDCVLGGKHLQVMAWNRFSQSSYSIQPQLKKLMKDPYFIASLGSEATENPHATEQFLIAGLNKFSSPMRGQLISSIKSHRIDIFGGDLSYGRINDPLMKINQPNIYYHLATNDYQDSKHIYQSSRINLNISSLQFDSAVNNRLIDIIASGGFVLTDKRDDTEKLFSHTPEITYETPEELEEKISFFSKQENNKLRKEIAYHLQEEASQKYTYKNTCELLINKTKEQKWN